MSRSRNGIVDTGARLLANRKGMAAVEFALIVPVLLVSYLGATDVTQGLAIDRKLGQVASTVSDLVAQEDTITRDQVHGFFESGLAIMRPFDFESTKLRLTIIEVDGGSTEVTGATARNWNIEARNGQSYDLPNDMIALSEGRYVVVADVSYDFVPMFGTVFNGTVSLEQRSLHVTRKDVEDFGFPPDGSPNSTGLLNDVLDTVDEVVDEVAGGQTEDDGGGGGGGDTSGGGSSGNGSNDNWWNQWCWAWGC
ncbi:TadE/TadG family type IV pilus assembly protein [Pelagibacterium sp.]|uniref:TadE/TadG family type IV pilus assembly protein n=1 Tax=Pelagibacterium sp. TaxID=1967288 RepID=UPI003A93DCF2